MLCIATHVHMKKLHVEFFVEDSALAKWRDLIILVRVHVNVNVDVGS